MTVDCPSCHTTFPVDPGKVPEGGVHARCSVCSEVFFVEKPPTVEAPEAPAADTLSVEPETSVEPQGEAAVEVEPAPFEAPAEEAPEEPEGGFEATVEVEPAPFEAPAEEAPEEPEGGFEAAVEVEPTPFEAPAEEAPEEPEGGFEATLGEPTFGEGEPTYTFSDMPEAPVVEEAEAAPAAGEETAAEESAGEEAAVEEPAVEETASYAVPQFGKRDPKEKAQRLARVLVSDIILYNPDRHEKALAAGTIKEEFQEEIEKSWAEYVEQVGEEMAKNTTFFTDALNEILARGEQIF